MIEDSGSCRARFTWPRRFVTFTAAGAPCVVDAASDTHASAPATPTNEARVTVALPTLPTSAPPLLLPLPPTDERRGRGASQTIARWSSPWDVRVTDATRAFEAARLRGTAGAALTDVDLVCRVRTSGNDFDPDGSAPELSIRLAWGFDHDVVGVTFATTEATSTAVGVRHASLEPGEAVKLSVVDVDALVDDWVGMDIAIFDGRLPLRFSHPRFSAECRAATSSPPAPLPEQQQGLAL